MRWRILSVIWVTMMFLNGCEPPEPVELTASVTIDASCAGYEAMLQRAITYVQTRAEKMPYHGSEVAEILAGQRMPIRISCGDFEDAFGWSNRSGEAGKIRISIPKVLTKQSYHGLFKKTYFSGTEVVLAGILAHEATHVWDFFYKIRDGEVCYFHEYEPDLNQYHLWGFGPVLTEVIACFDTTRRGCGVEDKHLEATLKCVLE